MTRSAHQRLLGASAATISNSACTFLSLLLFRNDPSVSDFVHIFSTISMIASVLNSYIFFGGQFGKFRNLRVRGLIAGSAGMICACIILVFTFKLTFSPAVACFSMAYLFQVVLAPAYRKAFSENRFRSVYARIVLYNSINFLGILIAILASNPWHLFRISVFVVFAYIVVWLCDPFFREEEKPSDLQLHSILNPSLTLLERSVFDQVLLLHTGHVIFTWLYYFLSRFISFFGTIFFNVSTERFLSRQRQSRNWGWPFLWALCTLIMTTGLITHWSQDVRVAVIFSQVYAWLLSSWLVSLHSTHNHTYWGAMSLACMEIIARWLLTQKTISPEMISAPLLSISLAACFLQFVVAVYHSIDFQRLSPLQLKNREKNIERALV